MTEDRYTRITLRIPKDLYAELQRSADETSKSINAEIVNRLSDSFDAIDSDVAAQLQGQLKLQTELANEKNFQLDVLRVATKSQAAVISLLGRYIGMLADMLREQTNPETRITLDLLSKLGDDIAQEDYASAIPRLHDIIEYGKHIGVFNEDGSPGPHHPDQQSHPLASKEPAYLQRMRAIYETGHDPANRPNPGTTKAYQDIPKKKGKSNPDKPKTKPKDGDVW